jgi:hypothetical protein
VIGLLIQFGKSLPILAARLRVRLAGRLGGLVMPTKQKGSCTSDPIDPVLAHQSHAGNVGFQALSVRSWPTRECVLRVERSRLAMFEPQCVKA